MLAIGLVLFVVAMLIIRLRNTLITDTIDGICGLVGVIGISLMLAGAFIWLWRIAP